MAPLYVAGRLPLLPFLCIVLFLAFFVHNVSPLLVYDRLTLLNIRDYVEKLPIHDFSGQPKTPPPLLASIPPCLWRPSSGLLRKGRRRRRGRRGGVVCRLRAYLASSSTLNSRRPPFVLSKKSASYSMRGSTDYCYRWLLPAVPAAGYPLPCRRPARICRRGCVPENLRPIGRASQHADQCLIRMALLNSRSVSNKTFILNDFFTSSSLDFLLLTETWLKPGENSAFSELLPPDCSFFSSPRLAGRGGGVAAVFKDSFKCRLLPTETYSCFELQLFVVEFASPVLCAVVYRPPKYNKSFIEEFSEFLADILPKYDKLLICGDFNVHVCCPSDQLAIDFKRLLTTFNLIQSVDKPTHHLGHTLDLIITSGLSVSLYDISETTISDHFPIIFEFEAPSLVSKALAPPCRRRIITASTADEFSAAFRDSQFFALNGLVSPLCPDNILSSFYTTCSGILDSVAPVRQKSFKPRSEPWLNDTTRAIRQRCRQAERKWKKDKLHVSLGMLRDGLADYQRAVREAKSQFLSDIIARSNHCPRVLFNTINSFITPPTSAVTDVSTTTCEKFLCFFINKVNSVRQATNKYSVMDLSVAPAHSAVLEHFELVSLPSLADIVKSLKPTNCPLDVVPAKMLKSAFNTVGPSLLVLVNTCLSLGAVPAAFKHAVVRPLLKKPNLDSSVLSNFRPVSHMPFLSKVLEKVVFTQLRSFLENNSIYEKFQSGFRSRHSTESALLRVHNDIALSLDAKCPVVLVLLDLTAAFDTVDHTVLLSRLNHYVGFRGTVLEWFTSYLSDRTFSVMIGDSCSSSASLSCGVPQGSILGPVLFSLYMLPLGSIIARHNLSFHCYADDLQIYLPFKPRGTDSQSPLLACIADIKQWLAQNFLHLNEDKTECIVFGETVTTSLCALSSSFSPHVRNLGVIFDSFFKFDRQVDNVVRTSFYQLRLLAKVKSFLNRHDLEKAVHALISSRLDYCNALYVGISKSSVSRLQLVQNAAARLLSSTKRREHITPVLYSLHWLPVHFRIDFKLLMFVFKALNGLAPPYLSELLTVREHGRALRSSSQLLLEVPRSKFKHWGDRAFSIAAPRLWNKLPCNLRTISDLGLFKSRLKTYLFRMAFNTQ